MAATTTAMHCCPNRKKVYNQLEDKCLADVCGESVKEDIGRNMQIYK